MTTPLWHHQQQAVDFIYPLQRGGLFLDMRCGKSRTALELFHRWDVNVGLITCPKSVINVWTSEDSNNLGQIHKYFPDRWQVVPLNKGTVRQKAEVAKGALSRKKPTLFVVNFESAWRQELGKFFLNCGLRGVAIDESHRIKGVSTVSSRFFARFGPSVKHRLCLTGTPIPKDPLDIWAQYRFLAPEVFPKYFSQFKAEYSVVGNYQLHFPELLKRISKYFLRLIHERGKTELQEPLQELKTIQEKLQAVYTVPDTVKKKLMTGYLLKVDAIIEKYKPLISLEASREIIKELGGLLVHIEDNNPDDKIDKLGFINLEKLHEKMYSVAFRVRARDVLDMPPEMDEVLLFDLEPKNQKLYNEFEKEMVAAYREAGTISAANVLVKNLRLQEFTAGWFKNDEGIYHRLGHEKDEMLADLLEDVGEEPLMIFCFFQRSLDNISGVCERAGLSYVELSGRRDESARFESGEVQVMIAQIKSGGVGKDFSRARIAVYYETGYLSPGDYQQSRYRLLGSNQKALSVTYFHLTARNTIDQLIQANIGKKGDLMRWVVDEINKKYK